MDTQHFPSLMNVTPLVGSIITYAGKIDQDNSIRIEASGWMLCDGRTLKASEYPELYMALGDLYGEENKGNEILFNIPDLKSQILNASNSKDADKTSINYLIKYTYRL